MTIAHRLLAAAALLAGVAWAADPPMPKVMSDAPATPGAWKMEFDGAEARGAPMAGGMTICQTAAQAMARDAPKDKANAPRCEQKLLEDSPSRAVMETRCGSGDASRVTITRVAPRSYQMTVQSAGKANEPPMSMRMSYVGPCSAGDSVMSLGKDSPACKQIQAQLAEMDKAKASCAKSGAQRAQCEQAIEQSRAQMQSMCR